MYDPAAFADKLEKWEEELWEVIDSWLLDKLYENEVGIVGTTLVNVLRTSQRTGSKLLTGTAADLLRLGTFDPDDTSAWGITKGLGANALRVISVIASVAYSIIDIAHSAPSTSSRISPWSSCRPSRVPS